MKPEDIKHTYFVDAPNLKVEVIEVESGIRLRRTYYGPEDTNVSIVDLSTEHEGKLLSILIDRVNERGGKPTSATIH